MPLLKKVQLSQGSFVGFTEQDVKVRLDPQPSIKVFIQTSARAGSTNLSVRGVLETTARRSKSEYYLIPDGSEFTFPLQSDVPYDNSIRCATVHIRGQGADGQAPLIKFYHTLFSNEDREFAKDLYTKLISCLYGFGIKK